VGLIHIHRVKCDGCDLEVDFKAASQWFHVEQYVTSEEEFEYRSRRAEETGNSGIINADLCSPSCMARWSQGMAQLQGLEEGL